MIISKFGIFYIFRICATKVFKFPFLKNHFQMTYANLRMSFLFLQKKLYHRKILLIIMVIILLTNILIVLWKMYQMAEQNKHLHNEIEIQKENKIDNILLKYEILRADELYLNEEYLKVVKLAYKNKDSKSVVDRATKRPLDEVLKSLKQVNQSDINDLRNFVKMNLHEPGIEIIKANFTDWTDEPKFLMSINNEKLREFSKALNKIWLDLYKQMDFKKLENGRVSSHLPLKHPFIVPGGRFIEIYYWDTYWTMEGLLVCGMFKTARKLIENFIYFIKKFGFIPNGSRVYYLNRSQPPFFSHMISTFYDFSMNSNELSKKDKKEIKKFILDEALLYMIKEHSFWMANKSIIIESDYKKYKLNIYKASTNKPRPEAYFEDIETARYCHTEEERSKIYTDIISATESGYDFSSRWFEDSSNMCTILTTDIIPVDLNSIIYKNELIISKFCSLKGDLECAKKFKKYAQKRKLLINKIFWSEKKQSWSDLNHVKNKLNENYYISDFMPLFMGILPPNNLSFIDYFKMHFIYLEKYQAGIPVSLIRSTQQWDFPNAWAPNQHSVVKALLEHDYNLALKFARKFFKTVFEGWKKTGLIFEKYDSRLIGHRGFGGEYEAQSGFGWTNGVILSFINIFKDDLLEQ